jgi:hypothetical protein
MQILILTKMGWAFFSQTDEATLLVHRFEAPYWKLDRPGSFWHCPTAFSDKLLLDHMPENFAWVLKYMAGTPTIHRLKIFEAWVAGATF